MKTVTKDRKKMWAEKEMRPRKSCFFFFCNRTPVVKCYYIKRTICVPAWDENEETFYLLQAFVCNIWRENITLNRISKCFSFRFFKVGKKKKKGFIFTHPFLLLVIKSVKKKTEVIDSIPPH